MWGIIQDYMAPCCTVNMDIGWGEKEADQGVREGMRKYT